MRRKRKRKKYTVYLNKDDSIVAVGTAEECAAQMGITTASFYSYITKQKKGKIKYMIYPESPIRHFIIYKDGEEVATGTAKECAKKLGFAPSYIYDIAYGLSRQYEAEIIEDDLEDIFDDE